MKTRVSDDVSTHDAPFHEMHPENTIVKNAPAFNDQLQLYKDLVETSSVLIWQVDTQGRYTFLNPAWEKTLGYSREEMLGRKFTEFQPSAYAVRDEQEFAHFFELETSDLIESIYIGKSGDRVHLVFQSHALRDGNGVFSGVRGTAYDITGRKQAEQRLRETEEKYRSIAELTTEWIWEMDLDGRHTYSNAVITTILGYHPREFFGKTACSFMHPDDKAKVEEDLPKLLAEKRGWRDWIIRWRHRDGTYRFLESNADPILDATCRILGYRGSDRDVTERIKAQQMERIHHEVVLGLFSSSDLRQGAEKVLHAVLKLECVDSGGFYIVDPATGSIDLLAHHGLSNEFVATVSHFSADAPRVRLLMTGEPRYGTYSQIHANIDKVGQMECLRAMAVIPIMCHGRLIAVLNLTSHTHDSIPPESRQSLETIAFQIGGMLLRFRTEVALRESEEIFRQFMDHSPIYVFFKDEKNRPIRLSSNFARMLSKPVEELLGKSMDELFPSKSAEKIIADDLRVLSEGNQITVEEKLNGRWYTTIKFPIDIEGKPRSLAGYSIDITDRKLGEDAIAAEKEQLAITLRSIGDGVITTDIQGRIVVMNKVAENLTGWTQEEVLGKPLSEAFHIDSGNTSQPCESPFDKVLSAGDIVELDSHTVLMSRVGTNRVVSLSGAPIKDRNTNVIGMVLVFRDMTEKQRLRESLQRIDKLNSLGILAGGIAHDFNNLLCGILGHLDLARSLSKGNPAIQKHLDQALGAFNRATSLTQQLLTFSKEDTPRRKAGQLSTLLMESAAFALSGSNVKCGYHLDHDLWLCDFDENQIGQVVSNIVINAQQAMPRGGQIEISASNLVLDAGEIPPLQAGKYVKVSIADSGIGISDDLLDRIFDPFFTTKQKGNGLGLSICHSIMQKHEGFIGIESMTGKGTTFHLYFPASQQEIAMTEPVCLPTHQGSGRILIMDDEYIVRDVVSQMLKTMGYTPVETVNGHEMLMFFAEARAKREPVCAAIFDLTIPGSMGGKEAIKELRKTFPDLPIFASSGYYEDPAMVRPSNFGFTDSIQKPYRIIDLADLLNRHLKDQKPREII